MSRVEHRLDDAIRESRADRLQFQFVDNTFESRDHPSTVLLDQYAIVGCRRAKRRSGGEQPRLDPERATLLGAEGVTVATLVAEVAPGGRWVKDETREVSGSHKARHLMGLALALEVAEWLDPALRAVHERHGLAIASCGYAALAAALVARAAGRPLEGGQTLAWEPAAALADIMWRMSDGTEVAGALAYAMGHRSQFMWPWETTPHSIAHGILDDETYDWHLPVAGMIESGGFPVVVGEGPLREATALAMETMGFPVDATGAAGLAGAIALGRRGAIAAHERLAVLFTGARR